MSSLPRRHITKSMCQESWDHWNDGRKIFSDKKFASRVNENATETLSTPLNAFSWRNENLPSSGSSRVRNTFASFQIFLDVSQFRSHEISVKTIGQEVVVHAKHPERHDEHGIVSREFTRRYILPLEVDPFMVTAFYDSKGILEIRADKKSRADKPMKETFIKVVKEEPTKSSEKEATNKPESGVKYSERRKDSQAELKKETATASATLPTTSSSREAREDFFKFRSPTCSSSGDFCAKNVPPEGEEASKMPESGKKYYESKSIYSSSSSIHTTTSVKSTTSRSDKLVTDV